MNVQKLKQFVVTLVLALGFVIAPSLSDLSAVQAKSKKDKDRKERRFDRDRDDDDRRRWRDRDDDDDDRRWRGRERRRRIWWMRHHRFGRSHRF